MEAVAAAKRSSVLSPNGRASADLDLADAYRTEARLFAATPGFAPSDASVIGYRG